MRSKLRDTKGIESIFTDQHSLTTVIFLQWTVNGKLRVGFFAVRNISAGEELTFDYQFQRFGEAAQLCYCGSDKCRGFLGVNKDPPKDMMTNDGKIKKTKSKLDPDSIVSGCGFNNC